MSFSGVDSFEPNDTAVFDYTLRNSSLPANISYICCNATHIGSFGIFFHDNPLDHMLPVLLIQIFLASIVILLTYYLLRPLGQPIMLAQILGGIIVGPSFLGRIPGLTDSIFSLRSYLMLDVISSIGYMFYFFIIGVETDIRLLKNINRKSLSIGISTMGLPMLLALIASNFLGWYLDYEQYQKQLPVVALLESQLSFPVVAYYLSKLRIINSEIGRVAICSSMVTWICSHFLLVFFNSLAEKGNVMLQFLRRVCYGVLFSALIILCFGPFLRWNMKRSLMGKPVKESKMVLLFLAVLICGLFGHIVGLHVSLGPLLLGLVIPSGPPLGTALVEKLDSITHWVLMPLKFVKLGLTVDFFAVRIKTFSSVQFVALIAALGKFLGAFLSGLFYQMQLNDAICLGFVVNFQGILEVGLFNFAKDSQIINDEFFSAMCMSLLLITGVITPIVRYFGDSSRKYKFCHGRTVMHSRPNSELRILVCIHDEEHVPSAINLLGALNPSKQSPIGVYMLHQIELTGSNATPLLIPHKLNKKLSSRGSGHVINAFKNFAKDFEGLVTVFPFIALSPPQTMHNDVCSIALEKGASLIIIPYYKRYHVNGETQSTRKALRIANQNVLDKAPCSVAILVDRGPFKSPRAFWTWSSYEVAVIFLGGADDREALALGVRMAGLPHINLTLIRILYDGECPAAYAEGNSLDNEVLHDFRDNISGNHRAMYKEELVTEGPGTAAVLRSLENQYELVVVGRRYDGLSPILSGLAEWNENQELGVIGDVLAASDFLGNTTILVVHQHIDLMLNEIESILK